MVLPLSSSSLPLPRPSPYYSLPPLTLPPSPLFFPLFTLSSLSLPRPSPYYSLPPLILTPLSSPLSLNILVLYPSYSTSFLLSLHSFLLGFLFPFLPPWFLPFLAFYSSLSWAYFIQSSNSSSLFPPFYYSYLSPTPTPLYTPLPFLILPPLPLSHSHFPFLSLPIFQRRRLLLHYFFLLSIYRSWGKSDWQAMGVGVVERENRTND